MDNAVMAQARNTYKAVNNKAAGDLEIRELVQFVIDNRDEYAQAYNTNDLVELVEYAIKEMRNA